MHAATQRLWETFWISSEESVQMPFYVMGPHTSASETLSVRWLLDHNTSSKSILPLLQSMRSIHFSSILQVKASLQYTGLLCYKFARK
jgi:hypothetical protein